MSRNSSWFSLTVSIAAAARADEPMPGAWVQVTLPLAELLRLHKAADAPPPAAPASPPPVAANSD